MRSRLGVAIGMAGCLGLGVSTTLAGPIDLDHVPARSTSVFHVDVEAAVGSTLGTFILEHGEDLGIEGLDRIYMIEQEIGLNPLEDIFGVTLVNDGEADRLVIVTTSAKVDDALSAIRDKFRDEGLGTFGTRLVAGHELIVIDTAEWTMFVSIEPEGPRRTVVAGRDARHVARVVALTRGEGESLLRSASALASVRPLTGAIIFFATLKADEITSDSTISKMLNDASVVIAQFGENEGEAFARVSLAVNEDKARLIVQMATGLVALGQFVAQSEDVADETKDARVALLSAIEFDTVGGNVDVSFRYEVEKLIEMLQYAQPKGE